MSVCVRIYMVSMDRLFNYCTVVACFSNLEKTPNFSEHNDTEMQNIQAIVFSQPLSLSLPPFLVKASTVVPQLSK